MKKIILLLTLITSLSLYGKVQVATTIFPVYDAARVIGGDKVEVTLLVRPGIEPHSFEPSPRDIARINKSEIFLYLDESMETWIHKFEKNIDIAAVSTAKGINLMEMEEEEEEDHDNHDSHHDHHNHTYDPHIWLDPILYIEVVKNITDELVKLDKENEDYYRENFVSYKEKLENLDREIAEAVQNSKYKKIIYAGHFSFGYFVKRYNLEYVTAYKNLSPNAKISPRDLQKVIELIRESGQNYIFQEALVNSRTAKLIAGETDTEILLLHQLGGIGKDDMSKGRTYIDMMEENLKNIKEGLEYGKDN